MHPMQPQMQMQPQQMQQPAIAPPLVAELRGRLLPISIGFVVCGVVSLFTAWAAFGWGFFLSVLTITMGVMGIIRFSNDSETMVGRCCCSPREFARPFMIAYIVMAVLGGLFAVCGVAGTVVHNSSAVRVFAGFCIGIGLVIAVLSGIAARTVNELGDEILRSTPPPNATGPHLQTVPHVNAFPPGYQGQPAVAQGVPIYASAAPPAMAPQYGVQQAPMGQNYPAAPGYPGAGMPQQSPVQQGPPMQQAPMAPPAYYGQPQTMAQAPPQEMQPMPMPGTEAPNGGCTA